jgi:hypothetical protein
MSELSGRWRNHPEFCVADLKINESRREPKAPDNAVVLTGLANFRVVAIRKLAGIRGDCNASGIRLHRVSINYMAAPLGDGSGPTN